MLEQPEQDQCFMSYIRDVYRNDFQGIAISIDEISIFLTIRDRPPRIYIYANNVSRYLLNLSSIVSVPSQFSIGHTLRVCSQPLRSTGTFTLWSNA